MCVETQAEILFIKQNVTTVTPILLNSRCFSCLRGSLKDLTRPTEKVGNSFSLSSDMLECRISSIFLAEIIVLLRYIRSGRSNGTITIHANLLFIVVNFDSPIVY